MRTRPILLALPLLAAIAVPAAAQAPDISGTWRMTVTVPGSGGTQDIDIVIEPAGEGIAVLWTVEGTEYKGGGTVTGEAIEWTMKDTPPGGTEVAFVFKGTIVSSDGTVTMSGDFGRADGGERTAWKAVRVS